MAERIAILEGFRSLFVAEGAGLVVDSLLGAGGGGFEVLIKHGFLKDVCAGLPISHSAGRTECSELAVCGAAMVRGFVLDGTAAGKCSPVFRAVALPSAHLIGVVAGIKFAIFLATNRTYCLFDAGGRAAGAVFGLGVRGIARADAGVGAVVTRRPGTIVMAERIAILEGFRSFFAAVEAGLVVDSLFGAGGGGFEVLISHDFHKEVCGADLTVFFAADLTRCWTLTGGRAAGVRGFVYDGTAAGIFHPVFRAVALPAALLTGVVAGIKFAIFFATNLTNSLFLAGGRATGAGVPGDVALRSFGKGRRRQQRQHHAAHEQDAEQSFFHDHSSLSSRAVPSPHRKRVSRRKLHRDISRCKGVLPCNACWFRFLRW